MELDRIPLYFEANQGQTDRAVKFLSRGDGYTPFRTPTEIIFELHPPVARDKKPAVLRMKLLGTAGTASYSIGKRPGQWRTDVATSERVAYQGISVGEARPAWPSIASATSSWLATRIAAIWR